MPDPFVDRWTLDQVNGWRRLYPGESKMVQRVKAGAKRLAAGLARVDDDGRPVHEGEA